MLLLIQKYINIRIKALNPVNTSKRKHSLTLCACFVLPRTHVFFFVVFFIYLFIYLFFIFFFNCFFFFFFFFFFEDGVSVLKLRDGSLLKLFQMVYNVWWLSIFVVWPVVVLLEVFMFSYLLCSNKMFVIVCLTDEIENTYTDQTTGYNSVVHQN